MNNKLSPFFTAGLALNAAGIALSVALSFADMPHNWIPIPIHVLAVVLMIVGIAKNRKS